MAFSTQVRAALNQARQEQPELHEALYRAVASCQDDVGLNTFNKLFTALKTYDRDDIQRYLDFTAVHTELDQYWESVLNSFDADQFHRYRNRLTDLWERMTKLPGVHPHIVWRVLAGYPDKDPGTTPSHNTAVFMINAALLTSMNAIEYSADTQYGLYADNSPCELSPDLMSFAIERASDVDRIVEIILEEDIWHPYALRYRLDGTLTPTTEAEALAYPLIITISDAAAAHYKKGDAEAELKRRLHLTHTNPAFTKLADKVQRNDLAALRAHADLIDYESMRSGVYAKALDALISDLREMGKDDLTIIDRQMVDRAAEMTYVSMRTSLGLSSNANLIRDFAHWEECRVALRTVYALGPESLQRYIKADVTRTVMLAVRHEVTTHNNLIGILEAAAINSAVVDGFL